jgi:hypothetical protein
VRDLNGQRRETLLQNQKKNTRKKAKGCENTLKRKSSEHSLFYFTFVVA